MTMLFTSPVSGFNVVADQTRDANAVLSMYNAFFQLLLAGLYHTYLNKPMNK